LQRETREQLKPVQIWTIGSWEKDWKATERMVFGEGGGPQTIFDATRQSLRKRRQRRAAR